MLEIKKEATKNDQDKVRMGLLPPEALKDIAEVFTFGAKKYSDFNYMSGQGLEHHRVYDSLQRHLNAYWAGEDNDEESGKSHLAHAGCCIMMLMMLVKYRPNKDDRLYRY